MASGSRILWKGCPTAGFSSSALRSCCAITFRLWTASSSAFSEASSLALSLRESVVSIMRTAIHESSWCLFSCMHKCVRARETAKGQEGVRDSERARGCQRQRGSERRRGSERDREGEREVQGQRLSQRGEDFFRVRVRASAHRREAEQSTEACILGELVASMHYSRTELDGLQFVVLVNKDCVLLQELHVHLNDDHSKDNARQCVHKVCLNNACPS